MTSAGRSCRDFTACNPESERLEAENYLLYRQTDFTATYMQVSNLQYMIERHPGIITPTTVSALKSVLSGTVHGSQRQVFFLFKKAADALAAIVCKTPGSLVAARSRSVLAEILSSRSGSPLRAAAEAIGGLPLIAGYRETNPFTAEDLRIRRVNDLSDITGFSRPKRLQWKGRSLVIELHEKPGRLLVLKFARSGQPIAELAAENVWMNRLSRLLLFDKHRFDIPEPLNTGNPVIYQLSPFAVEIPGNRDIDKKLYAVAFLTCSSYFTYPNRPKNGKMIEKDKCREVLAQAALNLARLASLGIIHTAVIPLFHNRVQRHRRDDMGLYQWRRGGRLDRWLDSCKHPNFCTHGIRDFEHFTLFEGPPRRLYEHIGTHVLSLILVAGSYCRNHDEKRVGLDAEGRPVDARDLFDREWIKSVLADVFANYYAGFTGNHFTGDFPRDLDLLSRRLVEEMGTDLYMEEILRVAEQQTMSEAEFRDFLEQRGFGEAEIPAHEKGKQDICILTGPHLGGFNQRISAPELIEYTASLSALCIMDRYCGLKKDKTLSTYSLVSA